MKAQSRCVIEFSGILVNNSSNISDQASCH